MKVTLSKINEIFIGRQAIYNRRREIAAYEILYRPTQENASRVLDGEQATSEVMLHSLMTIGLEQLVGPHAAFINITRALILGQLLWVLPRDKIVLEVLEDVMVDQSLLEALRALSAAGFRIALDDFVCNESSLLLVPLADIVKLDVLATPEDDLRDIVPHLRTSGAKALLAEKIETPEQYEYCQTLGFDYYQGHFFSQPQLVQGRSLPTNRITLLQLIGQLNDPDATLRSIESLVIQDVSLSYKLLRHINSAYFGLSKRVESIHRAVVLLGLNHIKNLATLISLASLGDSSSELITTALVRAKMCEILAKAEGLAQKESGFTVGLLSILDVMTQTPLKEVLVYLPLTKDINNALLHRNGPLGHILACTLAYERGDWHTVAATSDLGPSKISEAYFTALHCANQAGLKSL